MIDLLKAHIADGFNPLPPSKRGETGVAPPTWSGDTVSIRSPRRNEGRLGYCAWTGQYRLVSIRSPRRNEGRQGLPHRPGRVTQFQSAPPVETRGDQHCQPSAA